MTEKTNKTVVNARPTLFYDGTCGMCTTWAKRLRPILAVQEIDTEPLNNGADQNEMILRWDGEDFGGADAVIRLLKAFPITYLLGVLLGLAPFKWGMHRWYRYIASNRHCSCKKVNKKQGPGWWAMISLLIITFAIGFLIKLDGWIWMWLLAGANWFGFKWMCFNKTGGWSKVELFYFIWPGMDTAGFRYNNRPPTKKIGLNKPAIFITTGVTLIILLTQIDHPYARGWLGFMAMLCLLHFGVFEVLAAILNRFGFSVEPIMRNPWLANGLGDFWGNRWNRAFSDWTRDFLFYPLTRRLGINFGTLAGFLASGMAHEIAISVPARAGYGLPTVYFLIQGFGLLIAKRFNFRKKRIDRVWMWLVILIPAPLLFHPPFFTNVFNPMIELITQLLK